jgi:D-alanyl-D-alanine-carboxypeptidase/D-alanyl-D-alanine-endopeptidase
MSTMLRSQVSIRGGRALAIALTAALTGCGAIDPGTFDDGSSVDTGGDAAALQSRWAPVRRAIDRHQVASMTLLVGDASGTRYTYNKGVSTATTPYRIASATKWITAATIMRLVEAGELKLGDHPQDYIDFWTDDPDDPRSRVTLEQLLSFTSGFRGTSGLPCTLDDSSSLTDCARIIYEDYFAFEPGTTFFYGPSHLHIAALMAERATGLSWPTLVTEVLAEPLGLENAFTWVTASEEYPLPSGGLRTTGAAYARFLRAIAAGEILADSRDEMERPRTVGLTIANTPIDDSIGPWAYALGHWRECEEGQSSRTCDRAQVSSSPGAFGFYPWYDRRHGYWAVLATELEHTPTFHPVEVMVELGQELQPLIEAALSP